MKKKGLKLVVFLFVTIFLISLIIADEYYNETAAYDCLLSKVEGNKCSSVNNIEDQIFALWATKECKTQVLEKSSNSECWPSGSCNLEMTAKALIGLKGTGADTEKIANWLLQHSTTPSGIDWFLQVDTLEKSNCEITYEGGSYSFVLGEDKKIQGASSGCFEPYRDNYWLKISEGSCLDKEFTITCDKKFISNLLYQESDSNVFYVSVDTHEGSAGGETLEKVNSLCFRDSSNCNYEGSLWAAVALDYLGYEIKPYLPYLIANANNEDYEKFLPDSFIYHLREYPEFRVSLLDQQRIAGYWDVSGNRFYDTALALLPFSGESFTKKDKAKDWLLDVQRPSGCWGEGVDDVGDTAFILYSVWPRYDMEPACYVDSDCSSEDEKCFYGYCIPDDGECAEDRHCSDGVCVDYQCVECRYKDDCADDLICTSDNKCVECVSYTDCGDGQDCNAQNKCYDLPSCEDSSDCENSDEQCIGGYCLGGFPECTSDDECTGENRPYCSEDEECVECRIDSHCGPDYECSDGDCIAIDDGGGNGGSTTEDCEPDNGYCRADFSCELDGGTFDDSYFCPGLKVCCSVPLETKTCTELTGTICDYNEDCEGGQEDTTASDLGSGEICCIGGTCKLRGGIVSECEDEGGSCRDGCFSDESSVSYYTCEDLTQDCCFSGGGGCTEDGDCGDGQICDTGKCVDEGGSAVWLWVLIVLVILVVVGIIFREKLRLWFIQLKSRFGGGASRRPSRPGFPPPSAGPPLMRRPMPRRILPPTQGQRRPLPPSRGPPQRRLAPPRPAPKPSPPKAKSPEKPKPKESSELQDVLKKLKEIGK